MSISAMGGGGGVTKCNRSKWKPSLDSLDGSESKCYVFIRREGDTRLVGVKHLTDDECRDSAKRKTQSFPIAVSFSVVCSDPVESGKLVHVSITLRMYNHMDAVLIGQTRMAARSINNEEVIVIRPRSNPVIRIVDSRWLLFNPTGGTRAIDELIVAHTLNCFVDYHINTIGIDHETLVTYYSMMNDLSRSMRHGIMRLMTFLVHSQKQ